MEAAQAPAATLQDPSVAPVAAPITRIDEVRQLSEEDARQGLPVMVEGVVTFFHVFREGVVRMFVQDETAGIYVLPPEALPEWIRPGCRVRVEGRSAAGQYAPIIEARRVVKEGESDLPEPRYVAVEELLRGELDSQRVRVRGVVTKVEAHERHTDLSLMVGRSQLDVLVSATTEAATEPWVDAEVVVEGVCSTSFNGKRQLVGVGLNVNRWADLQITTPAPADVFALPRRSIRSLFQFDPRRLPTHRALVEGTVTLVVPGRGVFLQDESDALFVQTTNVSELASGDRIQVAGFPQAGQPGAGLHEPRIRSVSRGSLNPAREVSAEDLRSGEFDSLRVILEATLLEWQPGTNRSLMVCRAGDLVFEVESPEQRLLEIVRTLVVGSELRLTGVWEPRAEGEGYGRHSRLWLRNGDDLQVVRRPAWWTQLYVRELGVGLVVLALAGAGWVFLLRREVADRTHQANEALAFLEAAMAQSPLGIVIADVPDLRVRFGNPAARRIYAENGAAGDEAVQPGLATWPSVHLALARLVVQGQAAQRQEVVLRSVAGEDRWIEASAAPIRDSAGQVSACILVSQDVTERRRAEQALRDSERRHRRLHQTMRDAFAQVDMAGRVVDFNPAFEVMLGYRGEELLQLRYEDFTPAGWHAAEAKIVAEQVLVHGASEVYEKEYRRKDGVVFPVELRTCLVTGEDDRPAGMWAVVRDITERKREQRVQSALASLSEVALTTHTLDALFPALHRILAGVMPAPNMYVALRDDADDLIHFPYYHDEKDEPVPPRKFGAGLTEHVLRTGAAVLLEERGVEALVAAGRIRFAGTKPVSWLGVPLRTKERTIGVLTLQSYVPALHYGEKDKDILVLLSYPVATAIERLRVEEALRESEERARRQRTALAQLAVDEAVSSGDLRVALDRMSHGISAAVRVERVGIWLLSEDESELSCESCFILSPQRHVPGFKLRTTVFPHYMAAIKTESRLRVDDAQNDFRTSELRESYLSPLGITSMLDAGIRAGGKLVGIICFEHVGRPRHWHPDEEAFASTSAALVAQVLSHAERRHAEAQRAEMQAQLLQAQKMESVGRLAGGVAHDFNNMLQSILGNVDLVLQDSPEGGARREHLLEIQRAAERSADLTRQLLAFARRQTVKPQPLDLNATVDGMLRMLQRLLSEKVQLVWMPGAGLWTVQMDPSQLDQVLVNLVLNARDALQRGGRIAIETRNVVVDSQTASSGLDWSPGEYVLLTVRDDGCGMDAQTLERIFEPFFTTKEAGKGTGLGLATVYGIVKQNRGHITVESAPGKGTTFRVHVPRASGGVSQVAGAAARPARDGSGTVLLVEDEPLVLKVASQVLRQRGYEVLSAGLPEDALRLAAAHAGAIHLLVTDVVMPGMNGRELSRRLGQIKPGIKCLYMSGYSADIVAHEGVLDAGVALLPKPFSNEELIRRVRDVLEGGE